MDRGEEGEGRKEREVWERRGEGVDERNAVVKNWKKKKGYGRRGKRLF